MHSLWLEMAAGDKKSYDAYMAFLDVADHNFPIIDDDIMRKLEEHGLAYRYNDSGEYIFDAKKLYLWSKEGSLGDGMKPIVNGLQ